MNLAIILLSLVSGLIEDGSPGAVNPEADSIMTSTLHRLSSLSDQMVKGSKTAVEAMNKASEHLSGRELFDEGKRALDRMIEEDSSPVLI